MNNDKDQLRTAALFYHRNPKPGKISLQPTTQLTNQYDLSMAYSPGVAAACEEIVAIPAEVSTLTSRANLVGVITNGTAVLGLGAIGATIHPYPTQGDAVRRCADAWRKTKLTPMVRSLFATWFRWFS